MDFRRSGGHLECLSPQLACNYRASASAAKQMNILHVAQVEIARTSGMGKVAWHWRTELERRGHSFTHIGRRPLGREVHPALYPAVAWYAARKMIPRPDLVLAHEPSAAPFARGRVPLIAFSHGIERRGWCVGKQFRRQSGEVIRLRSRLLYPLWRLRACDHGLTRADGALVLNRQDYEFCLTRYRRSPDSTFLFRNAAEPAGDTFDQRSGATPTILFIGTWIARKGIKTLTLAAEILHGRGVRANWLIAGTGLTEAEVVRHWPEPLRNGVEVIPDFEAGHEISLMGRAAVFVLPSFFEGQPLALLQAMAQGLPVVTSATCGQQDLIKHGENGLLFPPGDAKALADGLQACLNDEKLRAQLGMAARNSVAGRTWQAAAGEVAEFIEQIYRRARAGALGR